MPSTWRTLASKATGTEPLDIVVPYTTPKLTRVALRKAAELTAEIPCRIRVLRMQRVPFPLPLQHSPVSVDVLREQIGKTVAGLAATEISIYLTREPEETLLNSLEPRSILVIASKRRPWRTRQESLKRICERHGNRVALVYT